MKERLFTVHEANALIPRLEIIMSKLQRHRQYLQQEVNELARSTGVTPETLSTVQIIELCPRLGPILEEVEALLDEIESRGLQMKGLDLGLIDFPAERDGEIVLLCWQYGEKEVAYFHTIESGFAGRQALDPRLVRPKYLQ